MPDVSPGEVLRLEKFLEAVRTSGDMILMSTLTFTTWDIEVRASHWGITANQYRHAVLAEAIARRLIAQQEGPCPT